MQYQVASLEILYTQTILNVLAAYIYICVCVCCDNNKEKETINLRGNREHWKSLREAMWRRHRWKTMQGKLMFLNDVIKIIF